MVAPELKLTKKVTADKEGVGPPLPRIVVERALEVEPRRFHVLSADVDAHGHTGGCPGCAAPASHGRATKPHNDECRERIRTIIERTLTAKARMNAYKDGIAQTERVKESASASSDPLVALEYPASGETQDRPGPVFVQKSGRVDDDVQISALDAFYEMDGRMSRYIGEALDWYRGEDAADLKRSELNELVEKLTCLNALEGEIWKSNQKVVTDGKINPKILMDEKTWKSNQKNEELTQNGVMNEDLVQKIVMNEELVQKIVMNEELVQNGVMNERFEKN